MDNKPILATIDPEIVDRLVTRREAIANGARASSTVVTALAFGSIPIALAALTRETFGQAPTTVRGVLEFAFVLENLEAEFYKAVLGTSSSTTVNAAFAPVRATLTMSETATFDQIRKHEVAHVEFLRSQIVALGGTPATFTPASFDFTGGNGSGTGPFAAATTTKAVLLAAAQAFEDTGVRAYKGQAGTLISDNVRLEAALRIHSVEARHAAKIRYMRQLSGVTIKPWITGTQSGITGLNAAGQAVISNIYANEDNTTHNGQNMADLGTGNGGTDAVTEAFDEPLTYDQVINIVKDFIVGNNP